MRITVRELANNILPENLHNKYDSALPIAWIDDFEKYTGVLPCGSFVWLYDDLAKIFGRPFPLTEDAKNLLSTYNSMAGCNYPLGFERNN